MTPLKERVRSDELLGRPKRARKAVVQTVRRDLFDTVVGAIKEPYRTMMLLQLAVGLRPGEACRMRAADLDLETGDLITPRDGKTGERRLCFDTQGTCADALRAWLGKRPAGPYLFGGSKPIRVNTYNVMLHRCCLRDEFELACDNSPTPCLTGIPRMFNRWRKRAPTGCMTGFRVGGRTSRRRRLEVA